MVIFIKYLNFKDFQLIPHYLKFNPLLQVKCCPPSDCPHFLCNIRIICTSNHIHCSNIPKCSLYSTYMLHVQAKPSHRPAMYELANWTGINHLQCIHLSDPTDNIFGPPYITHRRKKKLFGPLQTALSTTALMYHTVNSFCHWFKHWYTFTICQIRQVHAASIVVLPSLLRQLKE
jgi:hypothetical protein